MEQEEKKEEAQKDATNTEDIEVVIDGEKMRRPLIELKDNQVNVYTLKITMSRRFRIVFFIDLWAIVFVAGLSVYMTMVAELSKYIWVIAPIGFLVVLCAIGKTIVDLQNWVFTMNAMQKKMGEWYMDDVIGICQDLINAGTKLAVEEVKKAKDENTGTEAKDANGESENP